MLHRIIIIITFSALVITVINPRDACARIADEQCRVCIHIIIIIIHNILSRRYVKRCYYLYRVYVRGAHVTV